LLKINNVSAGYGKVQILHNITLNITERETIAIIGSNGAGKTTLLRLISGLIPAKSGSISFNNQDITKASPHQIVELGISHVPEDKKIFPRMNVRENLEIGAYRPRARRLFKDTLEWVFELFPILKDKQHILARTLSGGQQQMLTIARALMSKPRLILLDEPSSGLAPKIVTQLFQIIEELKKEGITFLIVEQNVLQVVNASDYGYVMENGCIVFKSNSKTLLNNEHVRKAYLGI